MKDGFDKNVAEKMPRMQKPKQNRPWNVDPILIKTQTVEEENGHDMLFAATVHMDEPMPEEPKALAETPQTATPPATTSLFDEIPAAQPKAQKKPETVAPVAAPIEKNPAVQPISQNKNMAVTATPAPPAPEKTAPQPVMHESPFTLKNTETTIEEINSQFTNMLMERKDVQRTLDQRQQALNSALQQNSILQDLVASLKDQLASSEHTKKELVFLGEQLHDADHYIQTLATELDWKNRALSEQQELHAGLEEKYQKVNAELKGMAMLDVKASILERDLIAAQSRVSELEGLLEEETRKRTPLEEEIVELKTALDRVHASLSQIRLKAKREAYGL